MATPITYGGKLTCSIQSGDMNRAIAWYRDVLGFELMYRVDDIAWCELHAPVPGVTVGISEVEDPKVQGGATLVWSVQDIDKARRHAESKDVRFDGETMTIEGMVRLATFYDADGNKLMFSQSLG